jgi:glycosyltransferase involved in cell wall biosynthesis
MKASVRIDPCKPEACRGMGNPGGLSGETPLTTVPAAVDPDSAPGAALPARRILLAITALGAGGAERVIIRLAHHLVAQGHRVTLLTFEAPGTAPYYPLRSDVDLRQLGIPAGPWPLRRSLERVRALRRAVRDCRPDVVIAFLVKVNVMMALATRGLGVPLILSERNNPERQEVDPLWSWMRAWTYPLADRVVTPSRGVLACFPSAVQRRGRVIPNPVDRLPSPPLPSESRRIVAVGRLVPQKGFDLLLRAFAEVAPERPGWTLVIFGEGQERARLEHMRDELGLADRVGMPGITAAPGQWVEDAEIFVLSSRFESFGNVVTEAMSAGLAVVSFDCPWGPGDIVRHEVDGVLVPPEDVTALADALRRLMADRDLRRRLGNAARSGVRRFAAEPIMGLWSELIVDAMQAGRRPATGVG